MEIIDDKRSIKRMERLQRQVSEVLHRLEKMEEKIEDLSHRVYVLEEADKSEGRPDSDNSAMWNAFGYGETDDEQED